MTFLNSTLRMCLCLTLVVTVVSSVGLYEEFTWTRISYEWPNESELGSRYRRAPYHHQRPYEAPGTHIVFNGPTNSGVSERLGYSGQQNQNINGPPGSIDFQYVNNIPMGLNVWRDKLFISIPRRRLGVPSTLNYVSLNSKERHNVPLKPYPDWKTNLYPDPSGRNENLISVYRFVIDPCDRMWLVDTGILELPGNRTYVRPQHRIVVIDLHTDQIIHTFDLPDSVVTPATTLSSVTVDVTKDTCEDAYVYFPDLGGYGITVYSLRENRAWRVTHNYLYLESMKGEFFVAGHHFQWNDGVFSVELSNIKPDGYRVMYFHSLAGTHQFRVSTKVMRNDSLATRSYHGDDFEIIGDLGPLTQTSTAEIHEPTGIMFLGLVNKNALGCWNTNKPLQTFSIVHRDDSKMIYPSDVKIAGDRVYVLTTTMPGFLYGRLNYDDINFRVWSNDIGNAVQGTMCQNGIGASSGRY